MFTKKPSSSQAPAMRQAETRTGPGLLDQKMDRPASLGANEAMKPVSMKPAMPPTIPSVPAPDSPMMKDQSMNQKPATLNPPPAFRPDVARVDTPRADVTRPDMSRFDMPRRADAGAAPARPMDQGQTPVLTEMRTLTVGRDISLSGEISACDYLVVEGTVEARVREGRRIEIAECGLFRGTVEIDEADIAGRFEGDITVRGRLRVRSTGRIDGKIQYGELEIEAGGHLEGEVHGLKSRKAEKPVGPAAPPVAKARTIGVSEGGQSHEMQKAAVPQPVADKV